MQELVGDDALLIYHNAAYPKMIDCANGTDHLQNGAGKRTHFVQLNAAARVMVAKRCVQRVVASIYIYLKFKYTSIYIYIGYNY